MTISDPIPDVQYGKGTWRDYISNWRQEDAGYLQERSILRYETEVLRKADWLDPRAGQTTYCAEHDRLEMYSTLRASWISVLLFQNLTTVKDDATGVKLSHNSASGKGVTLGPTSVALDLPVNILNGTLNVDTTGVGVQSPGHKKALLTTLGTTDVGELVSDTPLTVPGLKLTGTGTINAAGKTVTAGILNADSATITNINVSGTLGGSGVLNGASGTIGGVVLLGSKVDAPSGITSLDGLRSSNGHLYGDVDGAVIRCNNLLGPFLHIGLNGGSWDNMQGNGSIPTDGAFEFNSTVRTTGNNVFMSFGKNVAPSFYSESDPGWWNFPEGTIWVN